MKNIGFAVLGSIALAGMAAPSSAQVGAPTVAVSASAAVDQFYAVQKNAPLWFAANQAGAPEALIALLRGADVDGYASGPALAASLEAQLAAARAGDAKAKQSLDRALSAAYVGYMQRLKAPTNGMLYAEAWVKPRVPSAMELLSAAARAPSLADHVRVAPNINPVYAQLRAAALNEAKLPGGGRSVELRTNLDRVRSLPARGRFVMVDIGSQQLWMYENGRVVDTMKVVVGKQAYMTPMIASIMYYTTFNPYWHVPDHLTRGTVAPNVIKQGANYLKTRGYEVVSDWSDNPRIIPASEVDWKGVAAGKVEAKVRQLPGGTNSMGKMKFPFANDEGIYLHDTPLKEYFAKSNRALSNGCVRLEDAKRLAKWLMGHEPVAPSSAPEQHVQIGQGVPIFLTYLTARPNGDAVAYGDDIYGWNKTATAAGSLR